MTRYRSNNTCPKCRALGIETQREPGRSYCRRHRLAAHHEQYEAQKARKLAESAARIERYWSASDG